MTDKDWILLIIPIIFNGLIVTCIEFLFERKKLRNEIKLPYYKSFSQIIKDLNNSFIIENASIQMYGKGVNNSLIIFRDSILKIIAYYDSNQLYLSKIDTEYNALINSWSKFQNITTIVKNPLTDYDKQQLGNHLQNVKNNLGKINYKLDKLMLKL